MCVPYNTRGFDGTDSGSDTQNARNCRNKDKTQGNHAHIIGQFQGPHIGKHVGTGRMIKYIVW